MKTADFAIIGGGIAGASLGARLAGSGSVIVVESEANAGFHATGRSAAYFAPAYGNRVVRSLTQISEPFYRQPPDGFAATPLLNDRDAVFIGREEDAEALQQMQHDNPALDPVDGEWLREVVPILRPGVITSGLHDRGGGDLDVDAILQGYLRAMRRDGGELFTRQPVTRLIRQDDGWLIYAGDDRISAGIVINTAGAWADAVAELAGLKGLGLVPKRRTAFLVDPPADKAIDHWPLVIGVLEDLYFKPDAGNLLISPADETPSPPTDAQPEEMDIAIAVDRLMQVADIDVKRIKHRWAGLRTFAPDKTFVAGFDPRVKDFFWLAGQGGYGVQSAPGLSELARHLITGDALPDTYIAAADTITEVSPNRLIQGS